MAPNDTIVIGISEGREMHFFFAYFVQIPFINVAVCAKFAYNNSQGKTTSK